jgi:hypothetical protein
MSFHVERHTSRLERAPRAVRACELCHSRKVRCDSSPANPQCSNCHRDAVTCQQRPRRRRTNLHKAQAPSGKSPPGNIITKLVETTTSISDSNDPGTFQKPLTEMQSNPHGQRKGQGEPSQACQRAPQISMETNISQLQEPSPSAISLTSVVSTYDNGYMERSTYIAPDRLRAEDGSEISYDLPIPSEATRNIAQLQSAFSMPPRAIRESLFENFWTHCYTWDPIVDRSEVVGAEPENLSPLLLQSIFLAGSRMISPSQPSTFASPQDYYTRAKTLFWLDFEKDPMTLLVASSLMHWWNPHGPELVSTNTSSFWCRITVSLAQQMGIHNTKRAMANEALRRRLWWSIVVSNTRPLFHCSLLILGFLSGSGLPHQCGSRSSTGNLSGGLRRSSSNP